jgi:hypothetical protein
MPSIFVCYRREDASGHAGRLHDRLVHAFGREKIFMDVDALAPGVDFDEEIRKTLSDIDVMLVVVGRQWADSRDEAGDRRLDNPDDYVRLEIATALKTGVRVIPVLVGGSRPPRTDALPEDIRSLARKQAVELSDTRWEYDTGKLIEHLGLARTDQPIDPRTSPSQSPAAPLVPSARGVSHGNADPRIANRPINLGFDGAVADGAPHGWFNSVGYVSDVSDRYRFRAIRRRDGKAGACLMLTNKEATTEEFGSVMQRFPATFLAGRTVQFGGELKTDDVSGWAGLWIRADGQDAAKLVFDNMETQGLRGTQDWSRYELQVDLPAETRWLNIGVVLSGSGTVWADDLHLRVWLSAGRWEDV